MGYSISLKNNNDRARSLQRIAKRFTQKIGLNVVNTTGKVENAWGAPQIDEEGQTKASHDPCPPLNKNNAVFVRESSVGGSSSRLHYDRTKGIDAFFR